MSAIATLPLFPSVFADDARVDAPKDSAPTVTEDASLGAVLALLPPWGTAYDPEPATIAWEDCAHEWNGVGLAGHGETCLGCGGWRGLLGTEPTVDLHVAHVVAWCRALRTRLADGAPLWVGASDVVYAPRPEVDRADEERRYGVKRRAGVKDRAIALPDDARQVDALAAAAERYVAALLGRLAANRDVGVGPDLQDVNLHGLRLDVKWTPREDGRLMKPVAQKDPKDLYVLVTGATPERFRVRGWAWRRELERRVRDFGHCPTHALDQSELRPFHDLLAVSGRPKPGEPCLVPSRLALALSADGWHLRRRVVCGAKDGRPREMFLFSAGASGADVVAADLWSIAEVAGADEVLARCIRAIPTTARPVGVVAALWEKVAVRVAALGVRPVRLEPHRLMAETGGFAVRVGA